MYMLTCMLGPIHSNTHCEYKSDEDNEVFLGSKCYERTWIHDMYVARCAKAIHLALPLGQHPCMDAARQVVLSILQQHTQNWPYLPPGGSCRAQADPGAIQLKRQHRESKLAHINIKGSAGGAASANAPSPRRIRQPQQCRPTMPTSLNVSSARRRCFGQRTLPKEDTSTATVPTH